MKKVTNLDLKHPVLVCDDFDHADRMVEELRHKLRSALLHCEQTTGVVLIDNVGLHLQREEENVFLGELTQSFPKIQFIVTSTIKTQSTSQQL